MIAWVFNEEQLQRAQDLHLPTNPALQRVSRELINEFLKSDAARKLRVERAAPDESPQVET